MINFDFTLPWNKGNDGLLGISIIDSLVLIDDENNRLMEADMLSIGLLLCRLNIVFNIREKEEE